MFSSRCSAEQTAAALTNTSSADLLGGLTSQDRHGAGGKSKGGGGGGGDDERGGAHSVSIAKVNAKSREEQRYTAKIAAEVTEGFKEDLEMFGYNVWDGASPFNPLPRHQP